MRTLFFILAFFWTFAFYFCCTPKKSSDTKTLTPTISKDTIVPNARYAPPSGIPDFTTGRPFQPDTKELKIKRASILKKFITTKSPAGPDFETIVDINYDGYRDYIIGYYGLAGTGFKYRIMAYVYSKSKNNYSVDDQISDLVNPSFLIPQLKITGFYIGLGGGSGKRLEWINKKWTITKEFTVDNNGDSTVWEIYYPLKKETEKIIKPFQVTPPDDILEHTHYF